MSNNGSSYHHIIDKYEQLKSQKSDLQDVMRRVNEFFSPSDKVYLGEQPVGTALSKGGELLDTTTSQVFDEYVHTTLGLYFNQEVAWFKLEFPFLDLESEDARALSLRAHLLYKLITRSNYYSVAPQHEWDVLVQGHGLMNIESDPDSFARCYTKDPVELFFVQSEDNKVLETYWSTVFTTPALKHKYPEHQAQDIDSIYKDSEVIYSVTPNTDFYRDSLPDMYKEKFAKRGKNKLIYRQTLLERDTRFFARLGIKSKNFGSDIAEPELIDHGRFVPARNIPSREHAYGNGAGKKGLVHARILNKLMRDAIISSGKMANPPRIVSALFKQYLKNRDSIQEGELVVGSKDTSGNKLADHVATLDVNSDLQSLLAVIQHIETKVANLLPTTSQTYKVARQSEGEIQQRLREHEKRLAPIRAHYLKESVSQHLTRFYQLAKKQGYFDDEKYAFQDTSLERKTPKINFDPFMLQTHRLTKSLLINQAISQLNPLFSIQPATTLKINGKKMAHHILEGNNLSEFIESDEKVEEQEQEIAEAQQQQAESAQQQNNSQAMLQTAQALQATREGIGAQGIGEV